MTSSRLEASEILSTSIVDVLMVGFSDGFNSLLPVFLSLDVGIFEPEKGCYQVYFLLLQALSLTACQRFSSFGCHFVSSCCGEIILGQVDQGDQVHKTRQSRYMPSKRAKTRPRKERVPLPARAHNVRPAPEGKKEASKRLVS